MAAGMAAILLVANNKTTLVDSSVVDNDTSQKYDLGKRHDVLSKGNINGVSFAVPHIYQKYPFEYADVSIWETPENKSSSKMSRSYEDQVSAFSLHVKWPSMEPKGPTTQSSKASIIESIWLTISVDDDYAKQPRPPAVKNNGLARKLNGIINRISERPQIVTVRSESKQGRAFDSFESDIHYEIRGIDKNLTMNWAEPVGRGTERFHSWNLDLYWQGDMGGEVTDLVSCYKGEMKKNNSERKCSHDFYIDEWGALVTVTYPHHLLSEWKQIKLKTEKLIFSFQK